jgi:oligopeptide/dipeptide ABC transporter ATP-binding protein
MYAGKMVETGTTEEVFYRPRMPYTVGLLGSLPRLDKQEHQRLTPIKGAPPSLLNLPPGCPFTPRCPIAEEICDREEPALLVAEGSGHAAACHFRSRIADIDAAEMFGTGASEEVVSS